MPLKSGNEAGTIFSRGGSHFEAGLSDGKDAKNKVNHMPDLRLWAKICTQFGDLRMQ